tara:strand:+ start:25883 stop:26185 length:303 start_codon:yes stop_codon:yes gene_type:complete
MAQPERLFAMQLALAAGKVNVDQMLDEMTSNQFSEWQAFYRVNPFGAGAETYRFAMQQAHIVNSPHFSSKKLRSPDEFMPVFKEKKQTIEQQIALFNRLG